MEGRKLGIVGIVTLKGGGNSVELGRDNGRNGSGAREENSDPQPEPLNQTEEVIRQGEKSGVGLARCEGGSSLTTRN
jgi:hypothetical protein